MPEKVAIAKFLFTPSSHIAGQLREGKKYETLIYRDCSTSCNCPGWTFKRRGASKRECKHTQDVDMFAQQIAHGIRRAEFWGGETLVDVTQGFIRSAEEIARFEESEQVRRQAEAVVAQAMEDVPTLSPPLGGKTLIEVFREEAERENQNHLISFERGGTPPPNLTETARKTQKGLAKISQREHPSVEDEDEPPKRRYNL